MTIQEIVKELNRLASEHKIGTLQDIRRDLKLLGRGRKGLLFWKTSEEPDGWAFHYGGRSEIQFNIGFEKDQFRYGLAFSLERSVSLQDYVVVTSKVKFLNKLIKQKPEIFQDYKMWYCKGKERGPAGNVKEIPDELVDENSFIFFGKLVDKNKIDFEEVLDTLDSMLYIYKVVESGNMNGCYWSKELKDITLDAFNSGRLEIGSDGKCHLKHIDGKHGVVSMDNMIKNNLKIEVTGGPPEPFNDVVDIINKGWVLA
jgi:hypothetical protein